MRYKSSFLGLLPMILLISLSTAWSSCPESDAAQSTELSFDIVPGNYRFVSQSEPILLQGTVEVSQDLGVDGTVESENGGFRFPDGSLQTTAAIDGASMGTLSPNIGLYSNRIPDLSHSASYVEVCFKGGAILNDQHLGGGATSGGNCLPGDVGWIIETGERSARTWEMAKAHCLAYGLRLPEPFEFKYCCKEAGPLGMADMTDAWEWAGNTAMLVTHNAGGCVYDRHGLAAPLFGSGGCNFSVIGWVAVNNGEESSYPFRCAR